MTPKVLNPCIFMMPSLERKDTNKLLVTTLINISTIYSSDLTYNVHTSPHITAMIIYFYMLSSLMQYEIISYMNRSLIATMHDYRVLYSNPQFVHKVFNPHQFTCSMNHSSIVSFNTNRLTYFAFHFSMLRDFFQ